MIGKSLDFYRNTYIFRVNVILLLYVLQSIIKGPLVFDICHFEFIHLLTMWRGVML
jgi:hypothetical protein